MKIKTSTLIGKPLDWAVATGEGCRVETWHTKSVAILFPGAPRAVPWSPSTDWSQGGPIIERDGIEVLCNLTETEAARFSGGAKADWQAFHRSDRRTDARQFASTLLIAAMRCYVARTLGDEVDVPEELV